MIDTPVTPIESSPIDSGAKGKHDWPPMWRSLALAVVMLVSIYMNFYQLGQNGFGNLYYASAISYYSSASTSLQLLPYLMS